MRRHQLGGRRDAEPLREHRAQRLDLHLAEARERGQVRAQLIRVGGVGPDALGVAAVLVAHDDREIVDALGHRAGEPVDRRPLPERRLEVGGGERPWIE